MDGATIIAITDAALTILSKIPALRKTASQSGEMTPEQEAELDAKLKAGFAASHWQPSDQPS